MMDKRIKEWFYNATTVEFRQDVKAYHNISEKELLDFIKESGVDYILNKNLNFKINLVAGANNPKQKFFTQNIVLKLCHNDEVINQKTLIKHVNHE